MDPQANWDQLLEAYAEGDWKRVEELAEALLNWLDRNGFPPRATTGTRWRAQARTTALTSPVVVGKATASGCPPSSWIPTPTGWSTTR